MACTCGKGDFAAPELHAPHCVDSPEGRLRVPPGKMMADPLHYKCDNCGELYPVGGEHIHQCKQYRPSFAEPDPPVVKIPSRNELIARGFLSYLKKCTTDDEAIKTLTALLDEIRSY